MVQWLRVNDVITVKLTANFEFNLELIEQFLREYATPELFDALLGEIGGTLIPNLEKIPGIGRNFLDRQSRSKGVAAATKRLRM